jgi:hypothetical protein
LLIELEYFSNNPLLLTLDPKLSTTRSAIIASPTTENAKSVQVTIPHASNQLLAFIQFILF